MKKIFVFIGLLMLLQNAAFAAEPQTATNYKVSDMVVYSDEGNFGLKDKSGNIVVDAQYKKLIRLGENAWIIQKGSRFGLMDSNGKILVKPKYRHVDRVLGKYAKLGNDKDYGLYDDKGNAVIPAEYSMIEPMFGEMFLTCKKYKYGIMNKNGEVELPEGVKKVTINNKEFKVTHLVSNTGVFSGYYTLTAADYVLKILSSISPAYEQTIDELMFSQGADGISIFVKLGWLPRFPFTYAKKYYDNFMSPTTGPLSDLRYDLKRQIK